MDVLEIIRRHPFGSDTAQRGLPGVRVGVDEPRHDDLVGGIDHLVGGGVEIAAGGLDGVAALENFTALDLADGGIERHQPAALDERAFHRHALLLTKR
jgi:hypothetical protein